LQFGLVLARFPLTSAEAGVDFGVEPGLEPRSPELLGLGAGEDPEVPGLLADDDGLGVDLGAELGDTVESVYGTIATICGVLTVFCCGEVAGASRRSKNVTAVGLPSRNWVSLRPS